MPKGKAKPKTPVVTKFKVGDKVRVKHGIRDTDYPDMPLGGWAGTISETHDHGMYTVRWSRETLAAISPVFKKRCERDGMALEDYWLGDDDLEPDTGSPLNIEHPTEIKTKPLSPTDQDDRIRIIFGLTSNDPLTCSRRASGSRKRAACWPRPMRSASGGTMISACATIRQTKFGQSTRRRWSNT